MPEPRPTSPAARVTWQPAATRPPAAGTATASRGRLAVSVAGSVAVLAAVGALVAGPGSMADTGAAAEPASTVAAPPAAVPAAETTAVCPDPPRLLSAGAGTDPQFSPVSDSARTTVTAVVGGTATGATGATVLAPLTGQRPLTTVTEAAGSASGGAAPRAVARAGVAVTAASVLRAGPVDETPSIAAAVLGYGADDGDLRGLAAATCQRPANDSWLLGASTTVGHTAVLTLHNPGTSPATVDLELAGTRGPIAAAGSQGLLLAPGSSRSIVLAGLAPDQADLGVRVRSRGAPVAAVIQQSVLRGLTPGGVEYLTPVQGPALSRTVPGVTIQSPAATAALRRGAPDAGPVLQLAVPGDADATVRVQAHGPSGQVALGAAGVVRARAGAVTTVDLAALPAGTWGLTVRSDVAVTAGVRTVRGDAARRAADIAQAGAAGRLGQDVLLPVVPVGTARLALTAPEQAATVILRVVGADGGLGPARTVRVEAGRTVETDPRQGAPGAAAVVLRSDGGAVYAAQVSTTGASGVTVTGVPEPDDEARQLPLRLGP
ncbi:hypothetical protein GCM10011512_19730 [Tersicoccus solisilvae]|uniref:Large extracellular alpha-helical protein n=1 Tax=Tersicoccus solisilvae TaxID=1882339 RepID=A0ABQ1P8J9_9MICC|nr:DUF5719 family protein [Tersicoccus solisilvae]GGC92712.1 hypothetical protein GCM10011512_19730 [Tersicoccus solisilvae]